MKPPSGPNRRPGTESRLHAVVMRRVSGAGPPGVWDATLWELVKIERRGGRVATGVPVSTYRLQLTSRFGFAAVIEVADYLADLGVTHVYLSPILEAVP